MKTFSVLVTVELDAGGRRLPVLGTCTVHAHNAVSARALGAQECREHLELERIWARPDASISVSAVEVT
jgi:hypothetical protein